MVWLHSDSKDRNLVDAISFEHAILVLKTAYILGFYSSHSHVFPSNTAKKE